MKYHFHPLNKELPTQNLRYLFSHNNIKRQQYRKRTSLPYLAFNPDIATHQQAQVPNDGQAQAGAAVFTL
jgi:hypothetical protein